MLLKVLFIASLLWNSSLVYIKTRTFWRVSIPRKYKWQVGYSLVYHARALHNYFIPRHRKHNGQHIQYRTAWLYSDWLYFLWHGINIIIIYSTIFFFLIGQLWKHKIHYRVQYGIQYMYCTLSKFTELSIWVKLETILGLSFQSFQSLFIHTVKRIIS